MDHTVVNELNAILKGEHMAIGAYERLIGDCQDEKVRNELKRFQQDHIRHAGELAQRIRTLGGQPYGGTGFAGLMASAKGLVESATGKGTADVLRRAYDGEDKGIAMAEEIVKGDLDDESCGLVKRILGEDHDHLRRMADMIGEYENME